MVSPGLGLGRGPPCRFPPAAMLVSVMIFGKFFGLAFSALLPLINPLGSALVFLGLVGQAPPDVIRLLARRIAINTTLFLITIELLGTALMRFFGISLPVMEVAGGLVLAAMGWHLLNQEAPDPQAMGSEANRVAFGVLEHLEQRAFYPFTFPVTAGPACIVVMITLSAHASVKGMLPDVAAHAGIAAAVILLSVAVFLLYGNAPKITARVPAQTAHGILRVIAFVLFCIGVQITWNGAEPLLKAVLKH